MIARAFGWIVGADLAADIAGDLLEERRRRAARSHVGAVLWFWRAAIATAFVAAAVGVGRTFRAWWRRPIRPGGSRSDWRQALRSLRRTPWYALTAAGVIALSIAFATTVFALVDGVLFKPLPYRETNRLFGVSAGHTKLSGAPANAVGVVSPAEFGAWRAALPDVQFATYGGFSELAFHGSLYDPIIQGVSVGRDFFKTLGMSPMMGGFEPSDFAERLAISPAVISYGFWQRWFGGDPSAIGRSLVDDEGNGIRVVGVLPRDFDFPWGYEADVITPQVITDPDYHGRYLYVLARLPGGLTAEQASTRLSAAGVALARTWSVPPMPNATNSARIRTEPVDAVSLEPIRGVLTWSTHDSDWLVFWAAVALIALGCLNVGGLAAARVQDRWRDLVLRRALGARAWDLLRLLAVENGLIVLTGTVAGVLGAGPLLRVTLRLITTPAQLLKVPAVDGRVLVFSALAAALCVVLITVVMARTLLRTSLHATLAEAPTTSRRGRWRSWSIVSGQVALALVMAVGGALVAGSLLRVWAQDPGFDVSRTALVSMSLPSGSSSADVDRFLNDLRRRPDVVQAGGTAHPVIQRAFNGSVFDRPAGVPAPTLERGQFPIESIPVTGGYLEATGLKPVDGRLPSPAEFESGAPVVVVSELVARQYWPGRRAVGQLLLNKGRTFTVVGVVPDARYMALDIDPGGTIYWPVDAMPHPYVSNLLVQFAGNARAELPGLATWIRARCPGCWIYGPPRMLADVLGTSVRSRTFRAWLFTSFGVASLVVVGVGILGLVAMTSNRRTKEIGIRMALGATPGDVTGQILREQIAAVMLGLLAGGLVAAWAVRFVRSYLYKLPVYDVPAWAVAIVALLLIAGLGALIPALRASRVDPVQALRVE
jgi:putative ABC transport system permease protein